MDYDSIDCADTGIIESMSYDAVICDAWNTYGDIIISHEKMKQWNNYDIQKGYHDHGIEKI